ncbi:MAG: carbohydrate ABC transporter permease [Spirochaetales bacterium]
MADKKNLVGRTGQIAGSVASYGVMGLFTVMTIYPIIWLIINSFKDTKEFQANRIGLPKDFTFVNYPGAWDIGEFDKLIFNSVFYTAATTLGIIMLSCLAGFAFAKIPSKATKPIYGSFVIGILLTLQSIMIPLYLLLNMVGLSANGPLGPNGERLAVLIAYIGLGMPMGIYLCTEYIKSIPTSLVEAARIDGAGLYRVFWQLILPMTQPVIMTLAILNITGTWNEFMLVSVLTSTNETKSLPLGIYRFSGTLSSDYGKQFAALVIGMAPMLLFYLVFQRQITEGVSAGAVKG